MGGRCADTVLFLETAVILEERPLVTYCQLGSGKQLDDIVMAGSHDAAITQGGGNAQARDPDIHGQADAGALKACPKAVKKFYDEKF